MRRFNSPFGAWPSAIVMLFCWKGERGMWIGIGITTIVYLAMLVESWYTRPKQKRLKPNAVR